MKTMWAPKWGLSGLPSGLLDGSATGFHVGPLRAAQIDLYGGYMGHIWVLYGQLISVYNNNSCMYEYIQPFGTRELSWTMTLQLLPAVTITIYQNPIHAPAENRTPYICSQDTRSNH